ncbi:histidine phosphatase superfamily [Aspergillus carlsbadensis]|nr:histidine phosphatase superfamily [Aspergillus carlsbadensis]
MSDLSDLNKDLAAALKILVSHSQNLASGTQPLISPNASNEVLRARQSALAAISRIQTLLASPTDFLYHLAVQNGLLACLQWLGEFQVLACIPLQGSVPIKDVADLASVPETHLSRIIRMTTTAGFLQEPQAGHVAHTALSSPFVTKPSCLDAAMFLAGTVAPAALQLPTATQRFGSSLRTNETAYNLAFNTPSTFPSICEQRPKLQRQWPAFLRYGTNDVDDRVTDLLSRLDQFRGGTISVVEVSARSIDRATFLATLYPNLHIIVQIQTATSSSAFDDFRQLTTSINANTASNITIQHRTLTAPQPILDASIYILHLPQPSPITPFEALTPLITTELRAHLDVLRANPTATLILTPRLLPKPASVNPDVEAAARLRDLALLQLANEREIGLEEWLAILNSVSDNMGRLVVVNKIRSRESVVVLLEVRYQAFKSVMPVNLPVLEFRPRLEDQSSTMSAYLSIALLVFSSFIRAFAQDQSPRIWAAFAYNVYGEAVPTAFPRPRALTSHGANQLHDAGSAFRNRYVSLNSTDRSLRIQNLSPYLLDNDDIKVSSTPDVAALASAQAFMQGLYPPLDVSFNASFFGQDSRLADGSSSIAPMGGYQYPPILTFGYEDPQSLTISGQALCPAHAYANVEYIGSKEFWETYEESAAFYNRLQSFAISAEFDITACNYANATSISEFLDYQAVHNESFLHSLSTDDIQLARWYAGKYVWATNGNASRSDSVHNTRIRTIAGEGVASSVLNAFETNVQGRGIDSKMTLQFGGYQTAVSFTSLLQLAKSEDSNFTSLPTLGSSFILELFSIENETYPTYPDPSKLFVRFLLHNGTDADFRPYPLFGYSPSNTAIPFHEFETRMQKVSLGSVTDWCQRCNSPAVFCSGVLNEGQSNNSSGSNGISPAVGGVIGAVVTIVVLALIGIFGFLAYSWRTKRLRKPSLGGFKGNRKLASDADLRFKDPQWENATVKPPRASARGNERHGSWEMGNQKVPTEVTDQTSKIGYSLGDEIEEWQLHSAAKPVGVHEHV